MPVKVILVVGFCLGAFSFAQEVRQIDLTGAQEDRGLGGGKIGQVRDLRHGGG
jgi:hypothetical protein